MRGSYKSGQRRVLSGSIYKIVIGVILLVAAALVVTLLAVLPAMNDTITPERKIVSIEAVSGSDIGVGMTASSIPVKVTYSDGYTEEITLGNTTFSGLDVTSEGTQNVALSYGGFEQIITFNVVDINCHVRYTASVGGKIHGDTEQIVQSGGDASTVIAVPETGYVFVKWNDGVPTAQRKDTGIINKTEEHQAIFEKAKYYVRFYYEDKTVASEEQVTYGEKPKYDPKYGKDPKMSVYGYRFVGWSPNLWTDESREDKITIDRDMNFYPEYVKDATDYTVTVPLDKYGQAMGKLEIRSQTYDQVTVEGFFERDSLATIMASPYNSREFAYWQVQDINGTWVTVPKEGSAAIVVGVNGEQRSFESTRAGSSVQEYNLSFTPISSVLQVSIRAIFAYSNSDITFVNYQNPENNNVELKVSGLPFGTPLMRYKAGDVDLTGGLPIPTEPVGMQFEGWYELGDANRTLLRGSETFEQPTTLVARWKRIQYTLIFSYIDDGDNSVEWHRTKVTYQDAFASGTEGGLPLTNPVKSKYVFLGWQDALTGTPVDDRTKLYAEEAHVQNADFVSRYILNIVPIWAPKSHVLRVDFVGSGSAKLIVDKNKIDGNGKSLARTVDVLGEYAITEDHTYELVVDAMEGYKLVSSLWYYGGDGVPFDHGSGINTFSYAIQETSDNTVFATFAAIRQTVTVTNGDEYHSGRISYNGATYDDEEVLLYVNYNDSATIYVNSADPTYYISDICVNGLGIDGAIRASRVGETSFVLENVKSDATVVVTYSTVTYSLSVSAGEGGSVYVTDLFDRNQQNAYSGSDLYPNGTDVYLRVVGDSSPSVKKFLSAVRINGVLYDPYTNAHDGFQLYAHKINGVDFGVDLAYINDEYYYVYGEATYDGVTYLYCQSVDAYLVTVFVKTVEYGDTVYVELNDTAANYAQVVAALYDDLSVAEKDLYDTSIVRDRRITSVDIRIRVTDNYNVTFSFDDVSYAVSGESVGYGSVSVSDPTLPFGGDSVLVASPDAGYYVTGYSINGGAFVSVNTAVKGENYRLNVNNVDEDKNVRFSFERIGYKVVFINDTLAAGTLYVEGRKLNASTSFTRYYHDTASFVVTADDGKRIASVTVDGTPVAVHFNQTTYTYFTPDLKGDVTVRLTAANRDDDVADSNLYDVSFSTGDYVIGSAQYVRADATADNEVLLTTVYGYAISTVLVRDKIGGTEYTPAADPRGEETFSFMIPAGTFPAGAQVEVVASATPERYVLTTSAGDNGAVSAGSRPSYGDLVAVDVTASDNCYIHAVYVNGEKVSFEASYWSGLTADPNTGKYTHGLFGYTATSDMDLRAEFRVNSYKISVDQSSVNGHTVLSVGESVTDSAPHGSYVYVSMTADHGYHVSELYVNGTKVTDLVFETDDENERATAVYVYKGAYSAGVYSGVTGRINVKVVYEINRYYFVYNLVNDSPNFSSDTTMGTLTSSFVLNGNRYYGIEHGSNFSFDVTPTVSNGYYLYSLTIDYTSSLGDNSVTRYWSDGYFSKEGGTIWYNRFINDDSGDSGVVANISGITAVFRRNLYEFNAEQIGAEETGSVVVNFAHPNANVGGVYVYDGEQTAEKEYYFRNGVFYKRVAGVLQPTDIAYVYDNGTYVYEDGSHNVYRMLIEHGSRYTVTVAPALGYERISLLLNGTESNGFVSENRYSTNLVGDMNVVVSYRILVYDVTFSVSVIDKNLTATIDPELIAGYMTISLVVLSGAAYDEDYAQVPLEDSYPIVNYYTSQVSLFNDYAVKLAYGSKIKFVMTPKFSATGYYLFNFFLGNNEIPNLTGDRQVEVSYAGATGTGYSVIGDVTARCSFRIKRYTVSTSIGYTEDITGESVNALVEESGGTIAWNGSAYVRITVGQGYSLKDIFVRREGEIAEHAVYLEGSAGNDSYEEQMYYSLRNDQTNEIRDVLIIKNVTGDVSVRAVFEREKHVFRYKFNNASLLSVTTQYNPQNATGFPRVTDVDGDLKGYWESANVLVLETAYYDELLAIFTPNNGYYVTDTRVTIRAVVYNETTGEYDALTDNAGEEIATTLDLVNLGNDRKRFTFHNETSQLATLYVRYDLEVEVNVAIKTYALITSVNRINATGVENETEISLDVKDRLGNEVLVNGDAQAAQLLKLVTNANGSKVGTETTLRMTAEHHGYILYTFTAPEGFMLDSLSVNGYTWNDLCTTRIVDERLDLTVTTAVLGGKRYYDYTIRFNVVDALIQGRNNMDFTRIVVSMQIAPVNYQVKIFINNELREWEMIADSNGNMMSGVTDGVRNGLGILVDGTLSVYSPSRSTHFSTIAVQPALFEGYEVTDLIVKSGAEYDDVTGPSDARLSSTYFSIPANLSSRANYLLNYSTLSGVNALTDERTVYFFFTTHIISYEVNVITYAYTLDDTFRTLYPSFGTETQGIVPYDSLAGHNEVSVVTGGVPQSFVNGGMYEYFSTVRVEFYAKLGYKMYVAEELRNGAFIEVINNVNGIRIESSVDNAGVTKYTLSYAIDSTGDRQFRIVFKQQTTVTVHIPNPFKYVASSGKNNEYRRYATVEAYENGAKLTNENDDGTGKVIDTYVYTVLVGNFVSFKYSDSAASPGQTGAIFATYDPVNEKYTEVPLYVDSRFESNDSSGRPIDKGKGKEIDSFTELYVVNNVYGRITFSKTTYSATDGANGGDVLFNSGTIEPSSGYVYNATTTVGKKVVITVKARENFVLSRLLVRQIDYNRSVSAGNVIFKTGTYEWLEYDPNTFVDDDSNGFSIKLNTAESTATKTVYEVIMKGDMEIGFEFYRIYKVRYGVKFANEAPNGVYNGIIDKSTAQTVEYCYPNAADQSSQRIVLNGIDANEYAPASSENPQNDAFMYAQYDSSFTLTAPAAPSGYVFVGWYVNKYNTFPELDVGLPAPGSVANHTFYMTAEDTEGIMEKVSEISSVRAEAVELEILAVYMPVIDVVVINELYYYDGSHWNSWSAGAIRSEAYVYEYGAVPTDTTITTFPMSDEATTISSVNYNTVLSGATDRADVALARKNSSGYDTQYGWNLSVAETTRTTNPVSSSNMVYSSMKNFEMLYRYMAADEYDYDYWDDAILSLELTATPSTVKLIGWQYYNWNTGVYEDIGYRYVDRSYGQDSFGNYTTVDNSFSLYEFDFSYLYADLLDDNGQHTSVPAMPYAISTTTADNTDNNRPLVIRPQFVKVTRLEITQIAYVEQLGEGETIDNFSNVIHPVIDEESVQNTVYYNAIDEMKMTGEFDYGSSVHVDYYDQTIESKGGSDLGKIVPLNFVYSENQTIMEYRYRFVGWRLNWTVNGVTAFRYIYYAGQDNTDPLGSKGLDMDLSNPYGDEPPAEAYELQAVFILQYRHSLYSYNVAGSDEDYQQARDNGEFGYENAPSIDATLTSTGITAELFNRTPGPGEPKVTDVNIVNNLDKYNVGLKSKNTVEMTEYSYLECLVDVGSQYHLTVKAFDQWGDATDTENKTSLGAMGYDSRYDHQYYRYEYKNDPNKENRIEPDNSVYTGEDITVTDTYNYDLQYATTVVLVFENVMYYSGVTLPLPFSKYLTGRDNHKMTIWDVDETYGEGTEQSRTADGKVYIQFPLINAWNLYGRFDYSLNGFKSGNGIKARHDIKYKISSAGKSNGEYLFYANEEGFRRYVVIDYDKGVASLNGEYISGGSQLFGSLTYTGAGGRFSTTNTGTGKEASPYTIYNDTQLRNLGLYFNYNDYTCKGVYFALKNDIKLQAVNTSDSTKPYGSSKAWVPLTFALSEENADSDSDRYLGFDGVLDGTMSNDQYYTIYGLAADSTNLLSKDMGTIDNPLADFPYSDLQGYGIFGCVNGGTIKNVNIGNAYIELDSFGNVDSGVPTYVGVLTARAYGSTFENVKFKENGFTSGALTVGQNGVFGGYGSKGARVFVSSNNAEGIGLLAGYFYASTAGGCDIVINDGNSRNGYHIALIGGTGDVGGLIGVAEGIRAGTTACQVVGSTIKNNGSAGGLYVNYNTDSLTVGGLVGSASAGVKISMASISGNINMYLGHKEGSTVNVGGIVGTMNGSILEDCTVVSANESQYRLADDGIGIYIAAIQAVGKDEAVANASTGGKAGGMVGYAVNSELVGSSTSDGITVAGVINFYASVAGGIVGVAKNTTIKDFSINGPSSSKTGRLRMMVRDFNKRNDNSMSAYGTLAGAATEGTVIDNCCVVGGGSNTTAALNDNADRVLFVYQKSSETDTQNQSIPENTMNNGGSTASEYAKKVSALEAQNTYVGGLVGYLSGALYNSYSKNARVTVMYKNRAPQGDALTAAKWTVSAGGLVGYLKIPSTTRQSETFVGWESILSSNSAAGNFSGKTTRVQSCYASGSSVVLAGYIWCDGFPANNYNETCALVGCLIGGIVGSTSTDTTSQYGAHAINSCYTRNCHFIRNLGAYGATSVGTSPSESTGWTEEPQTANNHTYHYANHSGVKVEGGVFGIVSGLYLDDTSFGGACNYCWCDGNSASSNGWNGYLSYTGDRDVGVLRGIDYEFDTGTVKPNVAGIRTYSLIKNSAVRAFADWGDDYFVTGYGGMSDRSVSDMTDIGFARYTISPSNIHIIYGGAFVGVYNNMDGRVVKTDVATGLPYFAHPYIAARSDDDDAENPGNPYQRYSWFCLVDGTPTVYRSYDQLDDPGNPYNAWRSNNAAYINSVLVGGQDTPLT